MKHSQSNSGKCARALFAVALLGTGVHAFAADPTPGAPINVVIIDETDKGYDRAILYKHGIASRASAFN
jgi:hypothetical protein